MLEVHSGDSVSIQNNKKQVKRIFFPNVRAPTQNQSYSYESKEFLRKKIIGSIVRVEIEFSKNINVKKTEGEVGEMKEFTFATIFEHDLNISKFMLENGFVTLQPPKVEEDMTKYFEDLRAA